MKTLSIFVVELDKLINDTIDVGGKELFIDTRFEGGEFANRVNEGKVVCAPLKFDTGVEEGDTLYFHHHVVIQGGQKLFGDDYTDKNYICMYNEESPAQSQAIACKKKDTGEVVVCKGWIILEPYKDKKPSNLFLPERLIQEVTLEEEKVHKGRLAFESEASKELGINLGEIVGFRAGLAYPFKIEGKEYIRLPHTLVDYVQEEVHDA